MGKARLFFLLMSLCCACLLRDCRCGTSSCQTHGTRMPGWRKHFCADGLSMWRCMQRAFCFIVCSIACRDIACTDLALVRCSPANPLCLLFHFLRKLRVSMCSATSTESAGTK